MGLLEIGCGGIGQLHQHGAATPAAATPQAIAIVYADHFAAVGFADMKRLPQQTPQLAHLLPREPCAPNQHQQQQSNDPCLPLPSPCPHFIHFAL